VLRTCRMCDVPFEAKRDDHYFCSGKCVAAFYRKFPNPENIHAGLPHDKPHVCERCGLPYNVNAYAERGGQRKPKYCSNACKQAAYRERGQTVQEQARRRYEQTQRDDAQRRQREREEEQRQRERARQQEQHRRTRSSNHNRFEQACEILGIPTNHDKAAVKVAYRAMMKRWHPDTNKSPDAIEMAKKINWAYEYLK